MRRQPVNPNTPPWPEEDKAKLVAWRLAGVKITVIAARLGRSHDTVRAMLSRLGIVLYPERRHKYGRGVFREKVRKMLQAGMGAVEIAETLGVSPDAGSVSKVRKQLGYPPTPESERRKTAWRWRKLLAEVT